MALTFPFENRAVLINWGDGNPRPNSYSYYWQVANKRSITKSGDTVAIAGSVINMVTPMRMDEKETAGSIHLTTYCSLVGAVYGNL